jgi:hypothetical protein
VIVEWFMDVLETILTGVAGLFPSGTVPGWLQNSDSTFGNVLEEFGRLQTWVPIPTALTVLAAVLVCWGIGFAVKLVRIVLSFVTVGGGSAG